MTRVVTDNKTISLILFHNPVNVSKLCHHKVAAKINSKSSCKTGVLLLILCMRKFAGGSGQCTLGEERKKGANLNYHFLLSGSFLISC